MTILDFIDKHAEEAAMTILDFIDKHAEGIGVLIYFFLVCAAVVLILRTRLP